MASVAAAPKSEGPNYYIYHPVKGVSIAFAVLFAISGGLHVWQNNIKYKSWRIGFLLPWAALLFVVGFALREYGCYHNDNLDVFIASSVFLFLAPPVYEGANYFIFGRLLYYVPYLSPMHPGRVWSFFITLDAFDGIIAGNGAAYAVNTKNTAQQRNIGLILVKVSLLLLIAMILGFVTIVVIFHRRAIKAGVFNRNAKIIVYCLYVSNFLILIRNTFRTAAFFYPYDATANSKEALWWVLEALPMVCNTFMLNVWPPAKYLPKDPKVYLAMDGKTELNGPGMVDKRPFIMTVIDPFDIHGIITGSDNKNRYWLKDGIGGPKEVTETQDVEQAEPRSKSRMPAVIARQVSAAKSSGSKADGTT